MMAVGELLTCQRSLDVPTSPNRGGLLKAVTRELGGARSRGEKELSTRPKADAIVVISTRG